MLKTERREAICKLVDKRNTITTMELASALSVSEMTVRRDLADLAHTGRVVRVHGGARSILGARGTAIPRELTHHEKVNEHECEKAQVASAALAYIGEGSTIFLGTGTTVEMLARLLPLIRLRVITNSLPVVGALCNREGIDLCCIGGTYRPSTGAFIGAIAEDVLSHLGIDAAFIGLNGIFDHTASTSNTQEGRLQRIALDRANFRYLLADSSKLDRRDFYGFYDLVNVDALMTDRLITPEQEGDLSQYTKVVTR